MGVPLSGSVTTTDEGSPQLPASRCRPGPVVMLLAQPDILLKSVFRELDGAFAHRDIRLSQLSQWGACCIRRWEDGERQVSARNAGDMFLGESEKDSRAAEGRVTPMYETRTSRFEFIRTAKITG